MGSRPLSVFTYYARNKRKTFPLLAILTLGTIPFAFLNGSTSYTLLALLLVVRGFGIGGSMMPAMAAAYATLQREAIPRAARR